MRLMAAGGLLSGMYVVSVIQSLQPEWIIALPAAMVMARLAGGAPGLLLAAFWGLLIDAQSSGPLGVHWIGSTLSAWGVLRLSGKSTVRLAAVVCVLSVVETAAVECLRGLLSGQSPSLESLVQLATHAFGRALPASLALAVLAGGLLRLGRLESSGEGMEVQNRWRMLTN